MDAARIAPKVNYADAVRAFKLVRDAGADPQKRAEAVGAVQNLDDAWLRVVAGNVVHL